MRCHEIREALVAYLDGEILPAERSLIQTHLTTCDACQLELATLAATRRRVGQALHRWAARAAPSSDAWTRLEARLAKEARPSSSWLGHHVSAAVEMLTRILAGGTMVRKGYVFATLMAVLALAVASIFALRSATPVSAQQILERSSAARLEAERSQGILHTRVESYVNVEVSPKGGQTSTSENKSIHDSFVDLQTGKYRRVVVDVETGRVVDAAAFDGTYVYSRERSRTSGSDSDLTVYRHAQPNAKIDPPLLGSAEQLKQMFEVARNDPNVTLVGQEAWQDGRPVYVLRSDLPNARPSEGGSQADGYTTLYFDAETYKLLETRMTIRRDGKETLASYHRTLVDEILPDSAPVAWDLSDVRGVAVAEDPERKHTDVFVEPVSQQEFATRAKSAYRLRTAPEGLEMQILAPPRQQQEPAAYLVRYDDRSGGYIVIQGGVELPRDAAKGWETYTTANGMKLYFVPRLRNLPQSTLPESLKHFQSAIVEAPDGASFVLSTNLPLDIKALAEELVPIQ